MKKILLVEDDQLLAENIINLLNEELSCQIEHSSKITDINGSGYDTIILDWRLPDGRGIDFLKNLRAEKNQTPVIMLTSKSLVDDKVLGLELGANDYITKPFEPKELIARVSVQLRQRQNSKAAQSISFGDFKIDRTSRTLLENGRELKMTKLEFDLLLLLSENSSRAFSRDELLNRIWGFDSHPTTRTVDMHITQIRKKIGNHHIKTIHGIGYRFIPD